MNRVIVIGAGAAGLMAAISAAETGAKVLLLEKCRRPDEKSWLQAKDAAILPIVAN